jgi:agmatine/peptidylarginine deiminase
MLKALLAFLLIFLSFHGFGQNQIRLPKAMTDTEKRAITDQLPFPLSAPQGGRSTQFPDMVVPGEFEESQAVAITWSPYTVDHPMQGRLIEAIQAECEVWIMVESWADTVDVHNTVNGLGSTTMINYRFFRQPIDDIWMRDYGPIGFYYSGVDSLGFINLKYYPGRPNDNQTPLNLAAFKQVPVRNTDLYYEGGNFMTDGFGRMFYSSMTQENNEFFYGPSWTNALVRDTMASLFNCDSAYEFTTLECDGGTGHIDIYAKLLNEETVLVAEYDSSVTAPDRMIIEDNLHYFRTLESTYGRPYKIVRMPQATDDQGNYLTTCGQINSDIRGFVNGLFVNKTFIYPAFSDSLTGNQSLDSTAKAILEKALPGYKVVGIDARDLTPYGGALHCITMQIPVDDPIRIWHPPVEGLQANQGQFQFEAKIQAKGGVTSATMYWRKLGSSSWNSQPLTPMAQPDAYMTTLPNPGFTAQDTIEYYIEAGTLSGKTMRKPYTAPDWTYKFWFEQSTSAPNLVEAAPSHLYAAFPNPSSGSLSIPFYLKDAGSLSLVITNMQGQVVREQALGYQGSGHQTLNLNLWGMAPGYYLYSMKLDEQLLGTRRFVLIE